MFLSRLLRVLAVLLLLRLVLRAVAGWLRGRKPDRPPRPRDRELVRDRICNTFLPRERALCVVRGGREEYFCSAACRDRAALDSGPAAVQSQGLH